MRDGMRCHFKVYFRSLKAGEEMFTDGNPCATNADCTTYTPSVCNSAQGLCDVNVVTATTTPPSVHPNPGNDLGSVFLAARNSV